MDKYKKQKEIKLKNELIILDTLNGEIKRFKDLKNVSKLSGSGLNKVLQRLFYEEKIEKSFYRGNLITTYLYSLTRKGKKFLKNIKKGDII
jgi:DNA-binding HxlR family transcriptional regulator